MIKSKAFKGILVSSLLFSSISITRQAKADAAQVATSLCVISLCTTVAAGLIALKTYFAYQHGKKQYEILKKFRDNPYYNYEQLTQDARNLYYDQCFGSSISVESDYPVIWLEKEATANKNLLGWMFFNKALTELSKKLNTVLQHLRNIKRFQEEKKEFNVKYREQRYRDERIALEREKVQQGRR